MPEVKFRAVKDKELAYAHQPAWYVERIAPDGVIESVGPCCSKFAAYQAALDMWPEIWRMLTHA